MHKERLFQTVNDSWQALQDALALAGGGDDARYLMPGAVGDWSLRDLMAHVTTWEEEALRALPVIVAGGRLPRYASVGGIDAFNALSQAAKRELTFERVLSEMAATHQRLLALLDRVPESAYAQEGRFLRRLRQDTYGHWRLHTADVMLAFAERGR